MRERKPGVWEIADLRAVLAVYGFRIGRLGGAAWPTEGAHWWRERVRRMRHGKGT